MRSWPVLRSAITGNLTVTGQTAAGYVAITTTSQANPSTSTINFPVGDNRANGLTSPLGAGGKLWAVYKSSTSTATTQLVFGVTGYFSSYPCIAHSYRGCNHGAPGRDCVCQALNLPESWTVDILARC